MKHNDNLIAKYTFKETFEIIEKLKKEILTGNRAFSIQYNEIQNFFNKHKITKLKTQKINHFQIYYLVLELDMLEKQLLKNSHHILKILIL